MLLIILLGVVGFGIYTAISAHLYQKRFEASGTIFDRTTLKQEYKRIYSEAFEGDTQEYDRDKYFKTASDWSDSFRHHIIKKLTEYHSLSELRSKQKQTASGSEVDIDMLFPGIGTEGRRYGLQLVDELKEKLKRDAEKAQNPTAFKRRRRR